MDFAASAGASLRWDGTERRAQAISSRRAGKGRMAYEWPGARPEMERAGSLQLPWTLVDGAFYTQFGHVRRWRDHLLCSAAVGAA